MSIYQNFPSIAVTVPTWKRGDMFRRCVQSLLEQTYKGHIEIMCVVDHEPVRTTEEPPFFYFDEGDIAIAKNLQLMAATANYPGMRSVRIKRGPGRSNWRPGAIHFPVFEHWLQTKCDLVTYQFSDELSGSTRFERQVERMIAIGRKWCYLRDVDVINGAGDFIRRQSFNFDRKRVPCNQLMTPSIIVDRVLFEAAGGLDYPLHVAAKAEEWIQTHCGLVGNPADVSGDGLYFFREHEESLGHGQKPGSKTYESSIAETGWVEEDHWRLWGRVENMYRTRATKAQNGGRDV